MLYEQLCSQQQAVVSPRLEHRLALRSTATAVAAITPATELPSAVCASTTSPCLPCLQVLFDAGACYSIFLSSGLVALGPDYFYKLFLIIALDFIGLYFAAWFVADAFTLTGTLLTSHRRETSPRAFYDGEALLLALQGGGCCRSSGGGCW